MLEPRQEGPESVASQSPAAGKRPLVIAHRGASAYRPENTCAAYALAVEQAADMIEIDLHRTRDGAVVVAHDAELERIGGQGEIGETTLAELRRLDAGGGEPVPTLDEVLDRFAARLPFNLELKQASAGPYEGLPAAALEAVESRGLLGDTLFSSFYDSVLHDLRRHAAGARIALLVSPRAPSRWLERARALAAEAVNPERSLVNEAFVAEAHAAGLAVYVFTVDPEREMERLIGLGVDGLFTNVPDRMRRLVGVPNPAHG